MNFTDTFNVQAWHVRISEPLNCKRIINQDESQEEPDVQFQPRLWQTLRWIGDIISPKANIMMYWRHL